MPHGARSRRRRSRWRLGSTAAPPASRSRVRPFLSGRDYHALHHENPAFRLRRATVDGERVRWRPYAGVPGGRSRQQRRATRTSPTGTATSSTPRSARAASTASRISPRPASSTSISRPARRCCSSRPRAPRARRDRRAPVAARARDAARRRAPPARRVPDAASSAPPTRTSCARGDGQHDHRRLSVVHRLGPRHVHRAARPLPRDRPPRRRARDPARVGRRASPRACCRIASPIAATRPSSTPSTPRSGTSSPSHEFLARGRRGGERSPAADQRALRDGGRRDPRRLRRGHALRHPLRRRRPARRRRARRAAHLDGRQGRRLGGDAAHRQAGRGAGALAERARASAARFSERWASAVRARHAQRSPRASGTRPRGCLYDVVDVDHRRRRRRRRLPAEPDLRRRRPAARAARRRARAPASSTRSRRGCGRRSACARSRPASPATSARYEGGVRERDGAYHQGTVWPWLLGAFVEAWVRVRGGTPAAKREARERFLAPLLAPPRRGRPRPRLRDRRRRPAAHPARLPVPGLVGRRGAAPRPRRPA